MKLSSTPIGEGREGDVYAVVTTFGKTFELRYGYYDDKDRRGPPDTINARQNGVEIWGDGFAVNGATLIVNSEYDGICIRDSFLFLERASKVSITAGDDGFVLNSVEFVADNATVTVVAGDDAIDADNVDIQWQSSAFDLVADDRAITIYDDSEYTDFYVASCILNIEAGDDGIYLYDCSAVFFTDSELNITAADAGLMLSGIDSDDAQTVKIA